MTFHLTKDDEFIERLLQSLERIADSLERLSDIVVDEKELDDENTK